MAYEKAYIQNYTGDAYAQGYTGDTLGEFRLGKPGGVATDGALRFENIDLPQGATVISARLHIYMQYGGAGNIHFNVYGIKETNTALFSSNPFGRSRTTSVYSDSKTAGSGYFDTDCTAEVNEILSQGGWVSGNAMGFLIFDNGSDSGADVEDWSFKCVLTIQISATPNLLPTPITIPAPTFPPASDWGIRISEPGVDVKTATEKQLLFTSRKKELRILSQGETTASQIAHGLSYAPCVIGYYTDAEGRHIINYGWNVFQVGAAIASDGTNVYFSYLNSDPEYYYVFIDPLT